MKKKPGSNLDILNDSYEGMCYKRALEFLHNKRSDEEYINIHNDSGKRNTLACVNAKLELTVFIR
ncbi:hypothetical protein [Bacillus sp. N1-1]|uniref:hypothetical protein n=1 Tax=Bacillus sp. N1-1 TaxID=2682541 RepID=UPI001316606C|nr:hypothetical protein [Bacillus sp. N1-1]QHA93122.1 hypothetical protein GNK04_17685 [Bacillus sp. N1-1]